MRSCFQDRQAALKPEGSLQLHGVCPVFAFDRFTTIIFDSLQGNRNNCFIFEPHRRRDVLACPTMLSCCASPRHELLVVCSSYKLGKHFWISSTSQCQTASTRLASQGKAVLGGALGQTDRHSLFSELPSRWRIIWRYRSLGCWKKVVAFSRGIERRKQTYTIPCSSRLHRRCEVVRSWVRESEW